MFSNKKDAHAAQVTVVPNVNGGTVQFSSAGKLAAPLLAAAAAAAYGVWVWHKKRRGN